MNSVSRLMSYAAALERRYPGVAVNVDRLAGFAQLKGYTGWRITFRAPRDVLVNYGIVSDADVAKAYSRRFRHAVPPDSFGHSRGISCQDDGRTCLWVHVPDHTCEDPESERSAHSAKMQRQVAKLLRRAFALPKRAGGKT
jgi:hypothetical protein